VLPAVGAEADGKSNVAHDDLGALLLLGRPYPRLAWYVTPSGDDDVLADPPLLPDELVRQAPLVVGVGRVRRVADVDLADEGDADVEIGIPCEGRGKDAECQRDEGARREMRGGE
jgi:hypothetical protein